MIPEEKAELIKDIVDEVMLMIEESLKNHKGEWCQLAGRTCSEGICANCYLWINRKTPQHPPPPQPP